MQKPARFLINYYALLHLDTTASLDDVLSAIDRARCTLEKGGWKCWVLKGRGLDRNALELVETIVSDPIRRKLHDEDLFATLQTPAPPYM